MMDFYDIEIMISTRQKDGKFSFDRFFFSQQFMRVSKFDQHLLML